MTTKRVMRVLYVYPLSWAFDIVPMLLDALQSASWLVTGPLEWLFDGNEEQQDEAARIAALEAAERQFYDAVRQNIICLLVFIALYLFSYWIISRYKEQHDSDSLYAGEEDLLVYRISVWMCTFSLAGSIGSVCLLPFSILSAELLERFPSSYYLQWLSSSLLHSMWNAVFLISNLSLFIFLPFAYFFIESQGFNKNRNGVLQRAYETGAVCAILVVILLFLSDLIFTNLIHTPSSNGGFPFSFGLSTMNIPLLYSFVSLLGVVLLLVSTPLGFTKAFTLVAEMAQTRPKVTKVVDDDVTLERLQLCCQKQRPVRSESSSPTSDYGSQKSSECGKTSGSIFHRRTVNGLSNGYGRTNGSIFAPECSHSDGEASFVPISSSSFLDLSAGDSSHSSSPGGSTKESIAAPITVSPTSRREPTTTSSKRRIPLRQKSLRWYQHVLHSLKYTVAIVLMLSLTALTVLLVIINTLKLLLGYRALPVYAQYIEVNSRHVFGMVGVSLEMIIICYMMATSLVGVYSMPVLRLVRPIRGRTTMTAVIINCSLLVVLTSALPVLASTLGLTTFDLLGLYSSLRWLSNLKLVLTYNLAFAVVTTAVLANKLTSPVRRQIFKSIRDIRTWPQTPGGITSPDLNAEKEE